MNSNDPTHKELLDEIATLKVRIHDYELAELDHLKTQQVLLHSETKFQTLYNSTSDAIMLLDHRGFTDCNRATLEVFGCSSREEFCSRHPADLSPRVQPCGTDSTDLARRHIETAFRTGKHHFEWVHLRADTGAAFDADVLLTAMVLDARPVLQAVVRDITEQKLVLDHLRTERDFSATIIQTTPAFFVAMNPDGSVRAMNDAMLSALGYTAEEVIGLHYLAHFVPASDRDTVSEIFSRLNETLPTMNENRVLTRDGRELLVEWRGRVIKRSDGKMEYFFGLGIDITERREMEKKLRRQYLLYVTQQEAAIDGILVVDEKGAVLSSNQQFAKIWNISPGSLETGQDDALLEEVRVQVVDPGGFITRVRQLYESRRDTSRDEIALTDGRVLDRYSAPVIADDGEYYGRVWYFRDITDRKRMEDELKAHRDQLERLVDERTEEFRQEAARRKQKEDQYAALLDSIVEWVWETDQHFHFTYLSPRIQNILGFNPSEVLGKSPAFLMPPEEAKRAMPLIRKVVAERGRFISFQTIHFHKNDGRLIYIEANGAPYFGAGNRLLGYRGSCRDITHLKDTLDALKEREMELTTKQRTLEEVNAALRVLLKQREEDRKDLEGTFVSNVKEMVLPYIHRLQKTSLNPRQQAFLDVAVTNLNELVSPFVNSVRQLNFTPREIEVASLIREGRATKEIAEIMGIATSAVDSHRRNIRAKLDIVNKKTSLRSSLLTLK